MINKTGEYPSDIPLFSKGSNARMLPNVSEELNFVPSLAESEHSSSF